MHAPQFRSIVYFSEGPYYRGFFLKEMLTGAKFSWPEVTDIAPEESDKSYSEEHLEEAMQP